MSDLPKQPRPPRMLACKLSRSENRSCSSSAPPGIPWPARSGSRFEDLLEYPWAGPTLPERSRASPSHCRQAVRRLRPRARSLSSSRARRIVLRGQADRSRRTRAQRRDPEPDCARVERASLRAAANRDALAQPQLRVHHQARPDPIAGRQDVHGHRARDRKRNPPVALAERSATLFYGQSARAGDAMASPPGVVAVTFDSA